MKRVPKIFVAVFFLGAIFRLSAETVIVVGDYTTPASTVLDGDLIITNGSIKIGVSADLTVNGDVKIMAGSVFLNDGNLTVNGDLIVTNTLPSGSASVVVNGNLKVSGSLLTRSMYADADVTTTGAAQGGVLEAESITTDGTGKANVYALSSIEVVGEIATKSMASDAFVDSIEGDIYAGRVITNAFGVADVVTNPIWDARIFIVGEIIAQSEDSTAKVLASSQIHAGSITTSGKLDSSVTTSEVSGVVTHLIDVKGAIKTFSSQDQARVQTNSLGGSISAGAIITHGYDDARVKSGDIEVRGDIIIKSENAQASVESSGVLTAANIVTSAVSSAGVDALNIDVRRDIRTYSKFTNASVECSGSGGDIRAYRIVTNAGLEGNVISDDGSIIAKGPLHTKGTQADIRASDDLEAESVFTDGVVLARVRALDVIRIKDIISTRASAGQAYVEGEDDLEARSIQTYAIGGDGYVWVPDGDLKVVGDIRTYAPDGDAFVRASSGDIDARNIQTIGNTSGDDSIKASASTGKFQWFPNTNDPDILIKDCEFYLDTDHDWNWTLTIDGYCVLNGNGHQLFFGENGGILVLPGSTLFLRNIALDNLAGMAVRCEDDTATLSLQNVTWTQTGDTTFANGIMHITGECIINGPGTQFKYESSQTSSIHKNSTLLLTQGVTLRYDTDAPNRISMYDSSSQLFFNGAEVYSPVDIRFTRGTLVFENRVPFTIEEGSTLFFGGGVNPVDNIALDYHLKSVFDLFGVLQKDNV